MIIFSNLFSSNSYFKVFKFLREKEEAFAFGSHISEANFRWLFMIGGENLERVLEEFGKDENAKQSCRKLAESDGRFLQHFLFYLLIFFF